jgi:hypothetical protein
LPVSVAAGELGSLGFYMNVHKMKVVTITVLCAIAVFTSYWIGYYHATNDTAFILSVTGANSRIATVKYLKNGEIEKAVNLNVDMLDSDIAALKDIASLSGEILVIPYRVASYHDFSLFDQEWKQEKAAQLEACYTEMKENGKSSLTKQ